MREANATLIRAHYTGLQNKWTRVKIAELCNLLSISEVELAAYLNMRAQDFRAALNKNRFPGPVCLLLDLWENYYYHKVLDQPLKDFPSPI